MVLLDEPSEGIAPIVVGGMKKAVLAMRERGVAVLVSEQNLAFVATIADRAVLIEQGHLVGEATRQDLLAAQRRGAASPGRLICLQCAR